MRELREDFSSYHKICLDREDTHKRFTDRKKKDKKFRQNVLFLYES